MKKSIVVCVVALVLVTGCGGPSYDEQVLSCQEALAAHDFDADPLEEGERLPACSGLKKDDYNALVMSRVIDDLGWTDDEGNFDENKMLDSMD